MTRAQLMGKLFRIEMGTPDLRLLQHNDTFRTKERETLNAKR